MTVKTKMNPEVKTKWVEALRSGEYEQGSGKLRTAEDKFCCLGVLCDIAVKSGLDIVVKNPIESYPSYLDVSDRWTYDGEGGYLPEAVAVWAGIKTCPVVVTDVQIPPVFEDRSPREISLASLNDAGAGFEEIASIIEEQL